MSADTLRFILQVFAVFMGGGSVQLLLRVFNRRNERKTTDATSGATALDAQSKYIDRLQTGSAADRAEVDKLRTRLDDNETRRDVDDRRSARALDNAREEIERLASDLARTRANLAVAQNTIQELSHQLTTRSARETP